MLGLLGGRIPPLLGGLLQDDKQVIRVHLYAFFDEGVLDGSLHGCGGGGEYFKASMTTSLLQGVAEFFRQQPQPFPCSYLAEEFRHSLLDSEMAKA